MDGDDAIEAEIHSILTDIDLLDKKDAVAKYNRSFKTCRYNFVTHF